MIENAQLISLSRQIALQRRMDVMANNMANINTTGFKGENILFEEYLMPVARHNDFPTLDQPLSYVQDWATVHDMSAGAFMHTGNELDLALNGNGFFAVETPVGERYTRSGAFQLSNTGVLVDLSGNPVMGVGGQFQFGAEEVGISIAPDGTVSSSAGVKGQLRMVEFANTEELVRSGENLFAGGTPLAETTTVAMQGYLERSNVSGVAEMADMIRITRSYESISSLTKKQDELRRDAIQRLGSAQA
jgi:flagellar basal-body rod protein FlgF